MRCLWSLLALGVLCPGAVYAQDHAVPSRELARRGFFQDFAELDLESLLKPDDLSVDLAIRADQSLEEAPGVVTVVTAEEIRRLGARTLADVLRTIPGFDLQIDNLGRETLVVRGVPGTPGNGSSEKILILFNGLRLNEGITGGATSGNLQIPVGGLRKIEVQRGPGSALFGSGGLLAVVNLIPETTQTISGTTANLVFGSFGTQAYELKFGNVLGEVNLTGFVHFDRSDGDALGVAEDSQTLRDPAQLGVHLPSASRAPGTTTDSIKTVDTEYHVTFRNFEFDGRFKGESGDGYIGLADALGTQNMLSGRQYAFDLGYSSVAGAYLVQAKVNYTRSENDQHLNVLPPRFVQFSSTGDPIVFPAGVFFQTSLGSQVFGAEGNAQRTWNDHRVEAGVSLSREGTLSPSATGNLDFRTLQSFDAILPIPGAVTNVARTTTGIWAEDTWKATSRLTLTGALRWDYLNDMGGVWSPTIGAIYPLPQGPVLKLLYGRSYRAPSFDELYFNLPGLNGNPNLRSETADTIQAVFLWKRSDFVVTADYFFTALHDPITTSGAFDILSPQPLENGAGIHSSGFELSARRIFLSGGSFFVNFTHESDHDASTGLDVPGAPANLAYLGGDLQVQDWFLATPSLLLRDSRPRAPGDTRAPLSGYGLVDLTLRSRKLYRTLQVSLTAHNLLGKAYADPSPLGGIPGDYPRPGRSVLVLVTYKF